MTRAEAVPLQEFVLGDGEVTVQPADRVTYDRVAGVLDRRRVGAAGLGIVPGMSGAAH